MNLKTREFFDGIAILTDQRNMRVTMKQSAKGAVICGASCFIGGLLGGPIGMAVGSTIGGVSAWQMSKGQFKPVSEIIKNDLTDRQKEELMENIMASVRDIQVTDVAILLSMIMSTSSIQQTVLNAVVAYIGNEMKLQLVD